MIKAQVIGHLGKDCIVNTVNGRTVVNFSVAHTEKYKDQSGNQRDKTLWIEVSWWTDRTGLTPYLKKGAQVYVEGNPDVRTYQTNDGRQGASFTLRASSIQLLGGAQSNNSGNQNQNTQQGSYGQGNYASGDVNGYTPSSSDIVDDLPF